MLLRGNRDMPLQRLQHDRRSLAGSLTWSVGTRKRVNAVYCKMLDYLCSPTYVIFFWYHFFGIKKYDPEMR